MKYAIGIDVGGTSVKIGVVGTDGTLAGNLSVPTRIGNGGEHILSDIAGACKRLMTECGIDAEAAIGAGLGVPGAVTESRFVYPCVNLGGIGGFDISEKFTKLTGFKTMAVNDANAAALGEQWLGGGKGHGNMAFVTIGTGVGGGVVIDGKLVGGKHGAAGEIGHIKVRTHEDFSCGCGKSGCLEQYASASGIVRTAKRLLEGDAPSAMRSHSVLTAKDIIDCAKAGDGMATDVISLFADTMGQALAAVSCVMDPEIFVIGGGVSGAGTFILSKIEKAFRKYAFPAAEETSFALAELGNKAGFYGAARLIIQNER